MFMFKVGQSLMKQEELGFAKVKCLTGNNGLFKGLLRIKEITILPNMGLLPQHYQDTEVIMLPLSGTLHQYNSTGQAVTVPTGDVGISHYGPGVMHFEYNKSSTDELKFLVVEINKGKDVGVEPETKVLRMKVHNDNCFKEFGNNVFLRSIWEAGDELAYVPLGRYSVVALYVVHGKLSYRDHEFWASDLIFLWGPMPIELTSTETSEVVLMELDIPDYGYRDVFNMD